MWFQNLLVAAIVLLAAVFAAWRLPGAATRLRYAGWLKRLGGGRGALHRWGQRLEARVLRAEAGSACSGCSSADDHGVAGPKRLKK
jgi:hypothetical protein